MSEKHFASIPSEMRNSVWYSILSADLNLIWEILLNWEFFKAHHNHSSFVPILHSLLMPPHLVAPITHEWPLLLQAVSGLVAPSHSRGWRQWKPLRKFSLLNMRRRFITGNTNVPLHIGYTAAKVQALISFSHHCHQASSRSLWSRHGAIIAKRRFL